MSNVVVRLPTPHEKQKELVFWKEKNPIAQVLVAPCGVKVGKSFGSALWLAIEAMMYPNLYCVWIAPSYMKSKVGFRYIKYMLPNVKGIKIVESRLEITLPNGTFIKFLHGKDAEATIEGEAVDRFVVDETSKLEQQLWFSLFTTISQTGGIGIITGSPRGFTWYYELYLKAVNGDPFFCHLTLRSVDSPFVKREIVEQARKIMPKHLFDQYYLGKFTSTSSVFGDIENMFDDQLKCNPETVFWINPDKEKRKKESITGWDIAKHVDYSVFYTISLDGELIGYYRFRKVKYTDQVKRLKSYFEKYFNESDKMLRYDKTGVGSAIEDLLSEEDIDASITGVVFSQASKQEMVTITTMALDSGWHKAPRIERIAHEFTALTVKVTKSGLFSYCAPDGDHDDVVMAAILAISGGYNMRDSVDNQAIDEALDYAEENQDLEFSEAARIFSGEDDFEDDESFEEEDDEVFDDVFD